MASRLLAAAAALLLGGCNWYYQTLPSPDDLWPEIPWFDHMIKSRAVHPYQRADIPRTTVPGTVPVGGGEANWRAEFAAANTATADRLVNPTVPDRTLARGDTLSTARPGRGTARSAPGSRRLRCSPTGPAATATATSTASSATDGASCRDTATKSIPRLIGGRS
jgi:hypothetical protein